jgi:hypothetical protein
VKLLCAGILQADFTRGARDVFGHSVRILPNVKDEPRPAPACLVQPNEEQTGLSFPKSRE